ncbi:MAG: Bug family tripartite tricarboxylate transporter substrate binding protein [Burkholderiales bacterium]
MKTLAGVGCALALAVSALPAAAQSYPSKTLRIVVAFPAGGPIDIVARLLAPKLAENMGQQVIVDNRAGANGAIGTEHVARSAPDGYTMYLASPSAIAINPAVTRVPFDTLRDLAGVSLVSTTPELLVVHPSVPARSVKALVALAQAQPGKIVMASTGTGGLPHLALELFKSAAGIDMLHVPYKGAAPAVADVIGGQVHGIFADLPVLLPHVTAGKLRALAVASPRRAPLLPDLPTMTEQGLPSVEAVNWYGILVPARTPREIISRLNEGIGKSLGDKELRDRLIERGADPLTSTPDQFTAFLRADMARWAKIVRDSGVRLE